MRFEIECPYCKHKMQAEPSLFHLTGALEHGHGTCHKCDELFRLILILDEEQKPKAMEARVYVFN